MTAEFGGLLLCLSGKETKSLQIDFGVEIYWIYEVLLNRFG